MLRGLSVFLLLCITALISVAPALAQDDADLARRIDLINEMGRELNAWRLSEGLTPLVYNPTLEAMANAQASYVLSLPRIPAGGAIHTGAAGEDVRQRSQQPRFGWPYYGNPTRVSVTEIAAVGNVRFAINFWRGSQIHRDSVTNPRYREIGIAALPAGRDTLFIVVLGARPDVLPALVDETAGRLYLGSETIPFAGDWFGQTVRFRLFNADGSPQSGWRVYGRSVPLPDIDGDQFFVLYEDGNNNQALAMVDMKATPVFTGLRVEEAPVVAAAPSATATATSAPRLLLPTNTPGGPVPTSTPTSPPPTMTPTTSPTFTPTATATPEPRQLTLLYNSRSLTVINQGDEPLDISQIVFRQDSYQLATTRWQQLVGNTPLNRFDNGHCLLVYSFTDSAVASPSQCRITWSVLTVAPQRLFWTNGDFEVLRAGQVVGTCSVNAQRCTIELP